MAWLDFNDAEDQRIEAQLTKQVETHGIRSIQGLVSVSDAIEVDLALQEQIYGRIQVVYLTPYCSAKIIEPLVYA